MSPLYNRSVWNTTSQMPSPPASGVALRCTERWYESLHTTFASRRKVPHLPSPFRSGQGGLCLNSSLMKGLTTQAVSNHQMDGNKPNRSGLTASRRTGISASYCCVRASSRVLTSKSETGPSPSPSMNHLGGESGTRIE